MKNPTAEQNLAPELAAVAAQPAISFSNPIIRRILRLFPGLMSKVPDDANEGVSVTEVRLDRAKARIYRPEWGGCEAGLIWIHGGGLILGRAKMNDELCSRYARTLGITVASVEYRLAPSHRYPAAIDDCYEVWKWFVESAESLGVDERQIAVGGQSAGGGLAAALCQRVQDEGGVQPKAQLLFYPMLDDRTARRSDIDPTEHLVWTNKDNKFGWSAYLNMNVGEDSTPPWSVPARREELSGLPPAWVGVGTLDLFLDENKLYAQRLREAGVECQLEIVEGAPHAFDVFVPDAAISRAFINATELFLAENLQLELR